jgi:hypothetical protein
MTGARIDIQADHHLGMVRHDRRLRETARDRIDLGRFSPSPIVSAWPTPANSTDLPLRFGSHQRTRL